MAFLDLHFGTLLGLWIGLALLTFAVLLLLPAPYGRHARRSWGPGLPARAGWLLMELPALVVFGGLFAIGNRRSVATLVFLAIWTAHYFQRVFVFPLRFRGAAAPMPVVVALMAATFNGINGYFNGRYLFTLGPEYAASWLTDPRCLIGLLLFVCGFVLNLHSDGVLLRLRGSGQSGYGIPRGGVYELVSCPNYLGEILEWCGWALATWSMAGLSFAVWAVANLVPRALAHHRWYRERFPDYPARRRALIPFLF